MGDGGDTGVRIAVCLRGRLHLPGQQARREIFYHEGLCHACVRIFIVPADTRDDRAIARGMRLDCGIFEPGHKYGVWR
jgi:hypothetical protein